MNSKNNLVTEIPTQIGYITLGDNVALKDPSINLENALIITDVKPGKYEVYLTKDHQDDNLTSIVLKHVDAVQIKEDGYYSKDFFPLNKVTTESGLLTISSKETLKELASSSTEITSVAKVLVNGLNKAGLLHSNNLVAIEAGKGSHTIITQSDRYTKVFTIAIAFTI